jgi:hypothetical protein
MTRSPRVGFLARPIRSLLRAALRTLLNETRQTRLEEWITRRGQPRARKGRRVRAWRRLGEGRALLETIRRGGLTWNGFGHRDRQKSFGGATAQDLREARRRSARVSRPLGLLRAHGRIARSQAPTATSGPKPDRKPSPPDAQSCRPPGENGYRRPHEIRRPTQRIYGGVVQRTQRATEDHREIAPTFRSG